MVSYTSIKTITLVAIPCIALAAILYIGIKSSLNPAAKLSTNLAITLAVLLLYTNSTLRNLVFGPRKETYMNTSCSPIEPNSNQDNQTRYCAGCHAQLPPSAERTCCNDSGQCRCARTEPVENRCNCCTKPNNKPLSKIEREDLKLYTYLVSLLGVLGVKNHLH